MRVKRNQGSNNSLRLFNINVRLSGAVPLCLQKVISHFADSTPSAVCCGKSFGTRVPYNTYSYLLHAVLEI